MKVLKNIALKLVLSYFIILTLLYGLDQFTPFYWGNSNMSQRVEFYLENESRFQTLFFGPSSTYRHIDPRSFDKISGTKSFNLGCPGMTPPETYFYVDKILSKSTNTKTVLIEMTLMRPISDLRNTKSINLRYFLSPKIFLQSMIGIIKEGKPNKWLLLKEFLNMYFKKVHKLNWRKNFLNYKFQLGKYSINDFHKDYQGYLSKENDPKVNAPMEKTELQNKLNGLKSKLDRQKLGEDLSSFDQFNLNIMLDIIEKYEKKDIRVIFFLGITRGYHNFNQIYSRIPSQNRISVYNHNVNTEYYNSSYYYDLGHYNEKGAQLFTNHLALKHNQLIIE